MSVAVVIPHFYREREHNLQVIVDAFMGGSVTPDEIIIWANEPIATPPLGASIIQSYRNVGPKARFIAALAAQSANILFCDNDVAPEPRTLQNLLQMTPIGSIGTLEGRVYDGSPYRKTPKIRGSQIKNYEMVDLALGRMDLVAKSHVSRLLSDFGSWSDMDDMCFSAAAKYQVSIYVIPCVAGESYLINLDEGGVGMCKGETFYRDRDSFMRTIMEQQ